MYTKFHSPQLRQSIASLSAALDSGNFYEIMSNFGLSAGFGTTSGDGKRSICIQSDLRIIYYCT